MKRNAILALGIVAVIAETVLWHGPLGAGDRLATDVESKARGELDRLEMTAVSARFERRLLRRRLLLTGPADDFQRQELVRILDAQPGVAGVRWQSKAR